MAPIDPTLARSVVEQLAQAKARRDVEAALALYHPHATLVCPPWGAHQQGTSQLRRGLQALFAMAPDYKVILTDFAPSNDTLCAWGTLSMTLVASTRIHPPHGRCASTPVFILFRFEGDRICWESFHFDMADVARQSGVPMEILYP